MKGSSISRSLSVLFTFTLFTCNPANGMQQEAQGLAYVVGISDTLPATTANKLTSPKKSKITQAGEDRALLFGVSSKQAGEAVDISPEVSPQSSDTKAAKRFRHTKRGAYPAAYNNFEDLFNTGASIKEYEQQLDKLIEMTRRTYGTETLYQFLLALEEENISFDVSARQATIKEASIGNESVVGIVNGEISRLLKKYAEGVLVTEQRALKKQARAVRRKECERIEAQIAELQARKAMLAGASDEEQSDAPDRKKRHGNLTARFEDNE